MPTADQGPGDYASPFSGLQARSERSTRRNATQPGVKYASGYLSLFTNRDLDGMSAACNAGKSDARSVVNGAVANGIATCTPRYYEDRD